MRRLACLVLGLWLVVAGAAWAQDEVDLAQWDLVAAEAEAAVEAATLDDEAFEELRSRVASWRSRLLDGADANAERIDRLQSQIEALGPAPEDGLTEPESVANRRAELEAELTVAQAPRRAATEAYNRADGLISEIDAILRGRSADLLFEADPSPVNPLNWVSVFPGTRAVFAEIRREIRVRTIFDLRQQEIRDGLPVTLVLAALGLLLLLRSRAWMLRATERVAERGDRRGRQTLAFIVSFTQLLLRFWGWFFWLPR